MAPQPVQVSAGAGRLAFMRVRLSLSLAAFGAAMSTGWNGNGCVAVLVVKPLHCEKVWPISSDFPTPGVTSPQTDVLFLNVMSPFEATPPFVKVALFLKTTESRATIA